ICSAYPSQRKWIGGGYYWADRLGETTKGHKVCDKCSVRAELRGSREPYLVEALLLSWFVEGEWWSPEYGNESVMISCESPEQALHLVSDWVAISPDCVSLLVNGKHLAKCVERGTPPKTDNVKVRYKNIRALVAALDDHTPEQILAG